MATVALAGCSSVERTPMEQMMALQTVTPVAKPGTEMTAYALPTPDGAATVTAALAAETAMMQPGQAPTNAQIIAAANAQPAPTPPMAAAAPAMAATQPAVQGQSTQMASALQALNAVANPGQAEPTGEVVANVPIPQQNPLEATTAAAALPATAMAMAEVQPAVQQQPKPAPMMMAMSAMDSDFDTGEPVGLETLVEKRIIVPMPRPELIAAAYENANNAQVMTASLTTTTEQPTNSRPDLDRLISYYAKLNGIPEALVHRVVKRESTYNPRAYHNGNYGLMQIRYNTAKGLGYEGPAEGLFDAETNLKYATKYLRGAWMVAENQNDNAVRLYASGYYYHAKRKGLLEELGMK